MLKVIEVVVFVTVLSYLAYTVGSGQQIKLPDKTKAYNNQIFVYNNYNAINN